MHDEKHMRSTAAKTTATQYTNSHTTNDRNLHTAFITRQETATYMKESTNNQYRTQGINNNTEHKWSDTQEFVTNDKTKQNNKTRPINRNNSKTAKHALANITRRRCM
jgi:hypothetical protein